MKNAPKIVKILSCILVITLILWVLYLAIIPNSAQGINIVSILLIAPYFFSALLIFSIIAVYRNKKQKLKWGILVITIILLIVSIYLLKIFLGLPFGAGTN